MGRAGPFSFRGRRGLMDLTGEPKAERISSGSEFSARGKPLVKNARDIRGIYIRGTEEGIEEGTQERRGCP